MPVSRLPPACINTWKMSRRGRLLHRKWECYVLSYFFEYDSGSKYSSNRNIHCFCSQNCLEKQFLYSVQNCISGINSGANLHFRFQ